MHRLLPFFVLLLVACGDDNKGDTGEQPADVASDLGQVDAADADVVNDVTDATDAGMDEVDASPVDDGDQGDADGLMGSDDRSVDGDGDAIAGDVADVGPDIPIEEPPTGPPAATMPQAVSGAMQANPTIFTSIPLRVATEGGVDTVTVQLNDESPVDAVLGASYGDWSAQLQIGALADGVHDVLATVTGPEGEALASAELVIDSDGVQFTDFVAVGNGLTPRIHRAGDKMFVTWTEFPGAQHDALIVEIDGAGRRVGAPSFMVAEGTNVVYARAAVSEEGTAVLFQENDGVSTYLNQLRVLDASGAETLAPVLLDPVDFYGSWGGDIKWDGAGFVLTWRTNQGPEAGNVHWARAMPDGSVTGPVVIATVGDGDPIGGFSPQTFLKVAGSGDTSAVSFVRGAWNTALDFEIPRAQLVLVDSLTGGVLDSGYHGKPATDLAFHQQSAIFNLGEGFASIVIGVDLTDPDPNPPWDVELATLDTNGTLTISETTGAHLIGDPESRGELFLLAHPTFDAVLAWTDARSYGVDMLTGRNELYTATLFGGDQLGPELVIGHARFIEGTAQINAANAGSNVVLAWVDERTGGSILDSRPEVYLETLWY